MHSDLLSVLLRLLLRLVQTGLELAGGRSFPLPWPKEAFRRLVFEDVHTSLRQGIPPSRNTEKPTLLMPGVRLRVAMNEVEIAGVPCLDILPRPVRGPEAILIYLHGGGYCVSSPRTYRAVAAELALRAETRCIVPDYRLAPEYPYPAALDDALSVCRELYLEQSTRRILLAGDSAGGGLALALAARLQREEIEPTAILLWSPWVDLTMSGPSLQNDAACDILSSELIGVYAEAYLSGTDPHNPEVSPLFAELSGLPPMMVQATKTELLSWESAEFVRRSRTAGVDVRFESIAEQFHVFQAFGPILPEAGRAIRRSGAFLRERLEEDL